MKRKNCFWQIVLVFVLMGMCSNIITHAQTAFDITTQNGKNTFSYNQIPDKLVPILSMVIGNSYQWEQSSKPLDGFSSISGATVATYTFNSPLAQTTYFRRKITYNNGGNPIHFYSNAVKIEVVSINWENLNYVRGHEILTPGMTDWKAIDQLLIGQKLQTTTYLDGLGRPVQKISRETATPSATQPNLWGDVVQFYKYDGLGREPAGYLPYSTATESGKFKSAPLTEQPAYYTNVYNETNAYSSTTFDNSPLNRVVNSKSPGTSWAAGSGNSVAYELNETADDVQLFSVDFQNGNALYRIGTYAPNTLHKSKYTDENGKQVVEYTSREGLLILKKIQQADNPSAAHTGWICVYSVYDDFGRLCYQIQPEAVKWLEATAWSFTATDGQKVLNEFCFRYDYDEKGRTILKKAPGAKELYMLYDQRDRVVFMQDGNQRAKSPAEWTTNLYDELDRSVITALYSTTKTPAELQTTINNAVTTTTVTSPSNTPNNYLEVSIRNTSIALYKASRTIEFINEFESVANDVFETQIDPSMLTGTSHTVKTYANPIPQAEMNDPSKFAVVRYNYYDNYEYVGARSFNGNFSNGLAYSADPTINLIATDSRTLSKLTGTKVRVLGTSTFLLSSLYYDNNGRLIQTIEENIKSGIDITTNQYHFDDRLLSIDHRHSATGTGYTDFSILSKFIYDKIGRMTSIQKKFGTNDFKTVAAYELDDLGRLKNKRLSPGYTGTGKNELESLAYTYNLRGEITGINKDYALKTPGKYSKWGNFFGLYLGYDNKDNVFASQRLDGKVTGLLWNTQGDDAQRKYDFSYDNAGRLINALFNEKAQLSDAWSNAKMNFSVTGRNGKIEYDLNGNLLYMLQKGVVPGNAAPLNVDDLQYSYASLSNKLIKVADGGNLGTANGKLNDFADGTNGTTDDYVYDDNGNLVIDLNKNAKDLGNVAGANGIRYNFLDKPEEIRIAGKGTIKIVYDADGNKLQKIFTPEGGGSTVTTTYIHSFVYKENNLQYINFEEGRVRVMQAVSHNNGYDLLTLDGNIDLPGGKRGAYDFFVRDYQQNVRMILTEETHQGSNSCTMETNRAANEEPLFGQVDANGNPTANNEVRARFAVSSIPGQTTGAGWQNATIGNYVSRIGNLAKKVGPNSLLKVMAGDEVSATTIYYYKDPVTNGSGGPSLISDLLISLTQAIAGSPITPGITKDAAANITSLLNGSVPFKSAAAPDANNASGNNPKAYLSVLFFDERFNFVTEGSISLRVTQSGSSASPLTLTNIKAPKNGYAYVYVSNESDEMVYFDNLQVAHKRGRIVEENHYYAFGLKIAGISSHKLPDVNEGHIDNKNLYNDKELIDDADLDWYDYGFRSYDPQIGRFPQLDPLTFDFAFLTPYQYAGNEPIANVDLDGLEPSNVIDFANKIAGSSTNMLSNGRWAVSWTSGGVASARIFAPAASSGVLRAISAGFAQLGRAFAQMGSNAKNNLRQWGNRAESVIDQMGENFNARWEARVDPIHQLIDNPFSMISPAGPAGTFTRAASMEANFARMAGMEANAMRLTSQELEFARVMGIEIGETRALISGEAKAATMERNLMQGSESSTANGLRNASLAGKVHPKTGIPFDETGFPDFSKHLYKNGVNDVMITPMGSRNADFAAANKAAGFKSTPKGYTWHHHQTTGRMQLVDQGIHSQTGHTGGFALWKY